jgi:predicted GH43/DUF377 family glycosyl hydrolase
MIDHRWTYHRSVLIMFIIRYHHGWPGVDVARRWLFVILFCFALIIPAGPSSGVSLVVDTQIPEYILDDFINLTGNVTETSGIWLESTNQHFSSGNGHNVTITGNAVHLIPDLDVKMMNSGNPVLYMGTGTDWDTMMVNIYALKHNGTYYLFYGASRGTSWSSNWSIGVAISKDGVSFTKYSGNPILKSRVDSYDYLALRQVCVIVDNGKWHMWYGGDQGSASQKDVNICYATSSDGFNWTKHSSNPVLKNNANNGAWDGTELRPTGIVKEGNQFRLFYWGDNTAGIAPVPKLAMATSTDGINWKTDPNNPLYTPGSGWEKGQIHTNDGEEANGTYRVWTSNKPGPGMDVGFIYSMDGETWKDSGSALITQTANTIYDKNIRWPTIVDEGTYYTLYAQCHRYVDTRTYGAFKVTPTKLNGTLTSQLKDFGGKVDIGPITWNGTTPNGTGFQVYVRYGNSTRTLSKWTWVQGSSDLSGVSARYIQYKVELHANKDWQRGLEFKWFRLDYTAPIASVELNVDGGGWQSTTVPGNGTWNATVTLHDGDYDIIVKATDTLGGDATRTIPVKVDLYPPTGNITIEDGKYAHNSTWIKIDVEADDTHHPIQMQLSRRPDFTGVTWMDHIPSATYGLLGDPEGPVTIYVRLRDDAGRISETYNDTIVIDTSPPEGTLLINEGAKYTNSTTVTLRWNATDITGVVGMMASNDPDFQGAIWEDPMKAFSWALEEGDGVKTVYLKLRDFVGWETVLTDDIILDGTPPAASFVINQDAMYTTTRDVTLNISIHDDNPIRYKMANAGEEWPDSWRTTATPLDLPWSLSTGPDGIRTVRMLVMDAANNEFTITDDIILDTTPPEGELVLNEGAAFTNILLAAASLSASDTTSGLDRMRISESDDFTGVSWQTVKDSFQWPMPPGDGTKTLFVQLRDGAGLISTIDDSIILDTTPPTGAVSIKGVDEYATDPQVELVIQFHDDFGLDDMRVSHDSSFQDAVWVPYAGQYLWDLGDQEGEVNVIVEVRDLAGNLRGASVSTILDLTDPVVSVLIEKGAEATLERVNNYTWSASDSIGLMSMRAHLGVVDPDGEWTMLSGSTSITDRLEQFRFEGVVSTADPIELTLIIEVVDMAGRSSTISDSIWFVPELPTGRLIVGDGSGWTNSTSIDVRAEWTGGAEATHYRVSLALNGLEQADWVPIGERTSLVPDTPGGTFAVHGELLGPFGFTSDRLWNSINQDILSPVVNIVTPSEGMTEENNARLNVSVVDDQDPAPVVQWRINGGEWQPYVGDERLSLKEGDNLIEVMAQDKAGNVGTSEWTITSERGFSVGGASWLILLVIVAVAAVVAFYYWRTKRGQVVE